MKATITPSVSLIITAYNEEKRILEKIENTLKQDYLCEKLEIIVASDCSTDRTDEIVRSYENAGIRLIRAPIRGGKEAAQKMAVECSTREILVFTDVSTILPADAIRNIVQNFHDPTVGCVSSVDEFLEGDGQVSGEGAYVRYEMLLRKLESKVNTVVGLSGSFFAARREVCLNWAVELQSDFHTVLNSVRAGFRGVVDPNSIGHYKNLTDETKEYQRKVRTVLRGMYVLMNSLPMLNPFRYGMFSWQLFSHKLCRWLVPFALLLAFASNAALVFNSSFYAATLILQLGVYAVAFLGIRGSMPKRTLLKIPAYFVLVNLSIVSAWIRYLRGQRVICWESSQR